MRKYIAALFFSAIFISMLVFVAFFTDVGVDFFTKRSATLLSSEEVMQLCTNTIVAQVTVEKTDKSFFLGTDRSIIIAPVKLVYGFDLNKIDSTKIHSSKNGVAITIDIDFPEMELLYKEVYLDEAQIFEKGNILMLLKNRINDRNLLLEAQKELVDAAISFSKRKEQVPSRNKALSRIEKFLEKIVSYGVLSDIGLVDINLR